MNVEDTKPGGVPDTLEGKAVIHKDLDRLEGWASRNFVKLDKDKVLPLGWPNPWQGTGWGLLGWGAALQVRPWGSWWAASWT